MPNEMAHYACDCWDAELLTSYGWVECVGCADRSAFDLTQHSKATGVSLEAEKKLSSPKTVDIVAMNPNKGVLGKAFKKEAKTVMDQLANLSLEDITKYEGELESKGEFALSDSVKITKDMVSVKKEKKTVHVEKFTPSVIGKIDKLDLKENSICYCTTFGRDAMVLQHPEGVISSQGAKPRGMK